MYAFVDVYLFMPVDIENVKREKRDAKKETL